MDIESAPSPAPGTDELKAKVRIHSEQTVEPHTPDAISDQENLTS